MAHLWTGETPPTEYVRFVLCRDVYHCLPSELAKENPLDILADLECMRAEALTRKK